MKFNKEKHLPGVGQMTQSQFSSQQQQKIAIPSGSGIVVKNRFGHHSQSHSVQQQQITQHGVPVSGNQQQYVLDNYVPTSQMQEVIGKY